MCCNYRIKNKLQQIILRCPITAFTFVASNSNAATLCAPAKRFAYRRTMHLPHVDTYVSSLYFHDCHFLTQGARVNFIIHYSLSHLVHYLVNAYC